MGDVRAEMERVMRATLADQAARHDWYYRAVRPMPVPPSWTPGQVVYGDCSKGCQFVARWANAPDPMENNWASLGNSQTIWMRLDHVDHPRELEVGDPITFGRDGNEHAALVLEAGEDPLLWSFGHQGAPNSYRLSWDRRQQQYCKLPVKPYVPTPGDKLRAKTGFYSWAAWRLGEGPWRHSGPANQNFRPSVPRVIPPGWWARYGRFLKNRANSLSG